MLTTLSIKINTTLYIILTSKLTKFNLQTYKLKNIKKRKKIKDAITKLS